MGRPMTETKIGGQPIAWWRADDWRKVDQGFQSGQTFIDALCLIEQLSARATSAEALVKDLRERLEKSTAVCEAYSAIESVPDVADLTEIENDALWYDLYRKWVSWRASKDGGGN